MVQHQTLCIGKEKKDGSALHNTSLCAQKAVDPKLHGLVSSDIYCMLQLIGHCDDDRISESNKTAKV